MTSISPQVPRSATSIYGGIVAAVTTIAVSIILLRKLWETGNKSRDKRFPKQGHRDQLEGARDKYISLRAQASTTSRPHGDIGSEEVASIMLFQGSSNFQISETNATVILNGQFTKIQRKLICDCIANSSDADDNKLKEHVLTQSITTLPHAEAGFKDYRNKKGSGPCFKGTRVALLREMADCVTGSSESRMYILSGLAGTGKSTVAYTVASRAADFNLLAASFFFSRDEADRNNAKRFFTTIAYQLCVYNEAFAKAIGDVLKTARGSAAAAKDPQDQLQVLILDPLRSIVQSRSRPMLIVVDALHECDEEDVSSVLNGLCKLVQDLPSFKVILTTRPKLYLNDLWGSQGDHKIIHLQEIEDKVVDGDIRLYLNHNLSMEQVQKCYPTQQWCASDEEIDFLVCAAGRFFIIASTAVRYIFDETGSNPAAQMQKLIHTFAQDHAPFNDLDRFYTAVLRDAVPEDCDDDDIVSRYQLVIGAIILVQRPLQVPVSTLSHIININVEGIRLVLDKLQSVIFLGDDDIPRVYHKSFPDYLTDPARCMDPRLQINPRIRHAQIAKRCFEIMNKHLKRNILGLGHPAQFMSNDDGLKQDGITLEQQEEKIPQQLRYACVYWVSHLKAANPEDADLMNNLAKFADEHILYWFELLSLIGQLDFAHPAIVVVLTLLVQSVVYYIEYQANEVIQKSSSDLHLLLSDALRFITRFYEIIKRSALHTYYSALPFAPTDSLLYRQYIKELAHNMCTIEGGPENWDVLVANLNHGEGVDVVRFSLDGTLIVSCSDQLVSGHKQGKLKIWDVATGAPISTVPGHKFSVANDFSTVALSSDNIATLYNANGHPISSAGTMFTASSKIQQLAFSSESSRVAAALPDQTVWLWDSGNAELIDRFDGYWSQLQFSPTGTRFAYSLWAGIKLRDGTSGKSIADLQCGSSDKFTFSDDGSRIASLSRDCGLTLWDSKSGGLVGAVKDGGSYCLAVSANGSLLATADFYQVTLWSGNDDSLVQMKVLKLGQPASMMAFSLDNMLAIATRYSVKLYDVKAHTFISTLPFSGSPTALVFSPDCTRLAVGDAEGREDCSVYLWDIRDIDARSLKEETTVGTVFTLSQDCSLLACGFKDGTVELWGASPTKRRIASHQAHERSVRAGGFRPDGGLFASGDDRTIKLWDSEDGLLHGTLKAPSGLGSVTLSNSMLVAAGDGGVTLWSLDTLSPIHTFTEFNQEAPTMSITENNALIAIAHRRGVSFFDVMNHRTITTFDVLDRIHTMTFLPDNLQLVAQSKDGVFLSFNLINKHIMKGTVLKHLIQLPNISLWHGVPIWHCLDNGQHYFTASFSQHKSPIPMLWIPRHIPVTKWTQGSSMIALGCRDEGRVILLRLPMASDYQRVAATGTAYMYSSKNNAI